MYATIKTVRYELPEDMPIIDGMPASRPQNPDQSRKPWEG
jgi:hypothetical protein|nr:MAG TPA: hypothetical protein [Caudoviricetes sp.]